MMTTTALDLDYLTEAERDLILSVIQKDEDLHQRDKVRIDNLKSEIKALKMKGALKPGMDAEKSCARCREPFGWIFDRGELCPKCKQKVCERCEVDVKGSEKWLCVLCNKQKELDAMSGLWFFSQFRQSKRNKYSEQIVSGSDIVKTSFRKKNVHAKMNGTSRTTEEVRRALAKGSRDQSSSPEHEGESSDTQSMEAHSPRHLKKSALHDAAVPKDSEKIMLLDLLGGPSVGPITNKPKTPEPLQPTVHVQQVSSRRYSDSSSGDSDGISAPSSPQFSHRTESEYAPSESINSSFRSNSAVSSDGRCTMVTDNVSVISGISTAPPSMHESPVLNSRDNNSDSQFTYSERKTSDSVPEQFLQYQHLSSSNAPGEDIHRVHTVKVVSRGRSASESSSDGEPINNNNKESYYQTSQSKDKYITAQILAEKSWARSSGSDSSRTTKGRRDNSDGLSQGSESCAETGSTIDAPVLDPPSEFNMDDAHVSGGTNLQGARLADWDNSNQKHAIDNTSQEGAQQTSMKDKITALLAKYNVKNTDSNVCDSPLSPSFQINQNVHTIAPMIIDDFEVIDSPPINKKPRLNSHNLDESVTSCEESPNASFDTENINGEPSMEELEWDSNMNGIDIPNQKKDLQNTVQVIDEYSKTQAQKAELFLRNKESDKLKQLDPAIKPNTKNYSGINRDGDFLSDKTQRYPKTDENQLILPSHIMYQLERQSSRDSDEFSDSLSVITERTEPDDEDTDIAESDISEQVNNHETPVIKEIQSDEISSEDDFDQMFQANMEVLDTDDTYFKPISRSRNIVSRHTDSSKSIDTINVKMKLAKPQPRKSDAKSRQDAEISMLMKNIDFDGLVEANVLYLNETEKELLIPKKEKTLPRENKIQRALVQKKDHTINQYSEQANKASNLSEKTKSSESRKDSLALLVDEELIRKSLEKKRISVDFSQVADDNVGFLDDEEKRTLLVESQQTNIDILSRTKSDNKDILKTRKTERLVKQKGSEQKQLNTLVEEDLNQSSSSVDESHISSVASIQKQFEKKSCFEGHVTTKQIVVVENSPVQKQLHHFEYEILSEKKPSDNENEENATDNHTTTTDIDIRYSPIQKHLFQDESMVKEVSKKKENIYAFEEDHASEDEDYIMTIADFEDLGELLATELIEGAIHEYLEMDIHYLNLNNIENENNLALAQSDSQLNTRHDYNTKFQSTTQSPYESDELLKDSDICDDKSESCLVPSVNVIQMIEKSQSQSEVFKCELIQDGQNEAASSENNDTESQNIGEMTDSTDDIVVEPELTVIEQLPQKDVKSGDFNSDDIVSRASAIVDEVIKTAMEHFQHTECTSVHDEHDNQQKTEEEMGVVVSIDDRNNNSDKSTDILQSTESDILSSQNTPLLSLVHSSEDNDITPKSDILSSQNTSGLSSVHSTEDNDITPKSDILSSENTSGLSSVHSTKDNDITPKSDILSSENTPGLSSVHSTEDIDITPKADLPKFELTPSPILKRQHKSPVVSRTIMHPAFQKTRKSRPSSTGSTESTSFVSDSDSLNQGSGGGVRSSTPSRNTSAYLIHPSSASPSPTGTPYGSLGRRRPRSQNDGVEPNGGPHWSQQDTAEDSDIRSDIHSDFKSDEQQSIKSEDQKSDVHSVRSDVHSMKSEPHSTKSEVKSDGKSDSGFVKQDSVSSAMSVPSLCVTDASPNNTNELDEAEDDIDDLVSSFKNKSMSKSHGNLYKPRNSNLTTSFSSSVESVASIYSEAGEGNYGNIPVEGEIQFGMDYNYKTSTFEVRVKQCKSIAAVDTKKKRSDPYVKTYLLPDRTKSGKRKTRVRKHTLNPIFNEVIKYHIAKSELETRTLWVTVWHNDTFGRNDFLGEVTVPLDYEEFKETSPKWYPLQERTPVQTSLLTYKGDLNVALKYVTADNVSSNRKVKGKVGNKGEFQILVKQARNLTAVRSNGTSDPFCKGYLLPEKSKSSKQKTHVIKKNCNPQWNHTFVFEDISFEELKEKTLELTIWDHDRFTSNDFLGGVRLGLGTGKSSGKEVDWCDSKGEEISVWQSMLDRPNYWIEATLLLRPNMNSRKSAV